jgi:TPR repeat protein
MKSIIVTAVGLALMSLSSQAQLTLNFAANSGSSVQFNGSASSNSVDLHQIMRSAETGDAESQSHLADYYFTGTHGCQTNMIEAYKWGSLAAAQGNKPAGHLLQQLELFMKPEEIDIAKTRTKEFRKTLETKTDGTTK